MPARSAQAVLIKEEPFFPGAHPLNDVLQDSRHEVGKLLQSFGKLISTKTEAGHSRQGSKRKQTTHIAYQCQSPQKLPGRILAQGRIIAAFFSQDFGFYGDNIKCLAIVVTLAKKIIPRFERFSGAKVSEHLECLKTQPREKLHLSQDF